MQLSTRLQSVVGGRTAKALTTLGLETVADLVHHYPRRYVERGKLMSFSELEVGEFATVFAEVVTCSSRTVRPKGRTKELKLTDVTLRDAQGQQMKIAIFGKWNADRELRPGRRALFSGRVSTFNEKLQMSSPDYALIDAEEDDENAVAAAYAGALVPIYPANGTVSTKVISDCVGLVLDGLEVGPDPLPPEILAEHGLSGLGEALRLIHRPEDWAQHGRARRRLVWDEALVLQVVLAQRRRDAQQQASAPRPGRPDGLLAAFDASTPFVLTDGQREIGEVLSAELAQTRPMHRLLQGEVGSGKTLVALRAMLAVVDSGGQAALLAPTEVLAQQHARSLRAMLGALAMGGELGAAEAATRVALLTGSLSAAARKAARAEVSDGSAGIVVGTHALMSEGVDFADLGLVVVDEQHRFGVEQREALRAKGDAPHVLVMTATPIPRTVAMTVYGDLEVSTLSELPRGRSPIVSHVVPLDQPGWLDRVWKRVHEAAAAGRQSYVVCPRVGDADDPKQPDDEGRRPAAAVEEVLPSFTAGPLKGLRVAGLHGRMSPDAKDETMRLFVEGHLEVLVATTVIEVGVDVPNATVMAILDADRFGISQLHQLRGRIGRGAHPGLCFLVTDAAEETPARTRLEAVAATTDGFELSRLDLESRREGDVLGSRQSGYGSQLKLLSLLRDEDVILSSRAYAAQIVDADPALTHHPALAQAVEAVLAPELADYLERS